MLETTKLRITELARNGYPLSGPVDTEMLCDYGLLADPEPPTEREIAAICAEIRETGRNSGSLGNRKRPAAVVRRTTRGPKSRPPQSTNARRRG